MLTLMRFSAALVALSLAACGGGGSDDKPNRSSSSLSSTPASSVANSSTTSLAVSSSSAVSVSSSLLSSSSTSSSSAVALSVKVNGAISGFDTNGNSIELDADLVSIEMHLLDAEDNSLTQATPIASSYNLSEQLRFNADLSAADATRLAVTINYPGYTSYARRLDATEVINLDAKLQAVPVQTIVPGNATTVTGIELAGFNVQVSGDDAQQSNSLLIHIPQSLLPDDTSSLEVAVRTFDPNDPDDAEFFPGAYADSDGNELASVGFNFADIKTNSNETLAVAMHKARQQKLAKLGGAQKTLAQEPVMIEYQIPAQSCKLLESLGDADSTRDGFQVPLYTYNSSSGLWDSIGHGTVFTSSGQQVAATQSVFECDTTSFYLIALVDNSIFQREWWNLDYPLAFSQPIDYCAQIQIKNPEGQSLAGINGLVMDNDSDFNFASTFFTTDSDGKAHVRISQSSINPDLQAEVIFFNQDEFSYVSKTITLSSNCDDTAVQILELVRPQLCEVSGSVFYENGAPVTRNLVYGSTPSGTPNEEIIWGFDFAYSDAQGAYRLNLPCGGEFEIFNFASLLAQSGEPDNGMQLTRIDGNLDADEQSDNGQQVVMKTLEVEFHQPIVTGTYNPATDELALMAYGGFDAFPMTGQVSVKSIDGTITHQTFNGTFTADSSSDDEEMQFFFVGELNRTLSLPATSDSGYLLELTLTDAFGNTWTAVPGVIAITP